MAINFEINAGDVENSPALKRWLERFGAQCIREGQNLARDRLNTHTSYITKFAVEVLPGSPPKMLFGNTSTHAIYLEEGTDDHDVKPVNKKALRWFDPPGGGAGAAVFSAGHRVKGIEAKDIIRDAVSAAGDTLRET